MRDAWHVRPNRGCTHTARHKKRPGWTASTPREISWLEREILEQSPRHSQITSRCYCACPKESNLRRDHGTWKLNCEILRRNYIIDKIQIHWTRWKRHLYPTVICSGFDTTKSGAERCSDARKPNDGATAATRKISITILYDIVN
jgi:hypothetical protein